MDNLIPLTFKEGQAMIKIKRKIYGLALTLIFPLFITGCINSTPKTAVTGKIYLGESGLGVCEAKVSIGSSLVTTDQNGNLTTTGIKDGTHEVIATSHIGNGKTEIIVNSNQNMSFELKIPYPEPWVEKEFSEISLFNGEVICRWDKPKNLTYYFDSSCSTILKANYRKTFQDVQQTLNNFFTFSETTNSEAHLIIKETDLISGGIGASGLCTVRHKNNILTKATIEIDSRYTNSIPTRIHELGHALGMGHSPNSNHIMYPYSNATTEFTPEEINYLKGIYSLKVGPRTFSQITTDSEGTITVY